MTDMMKLLRKYDLRPALTVSLFLTMIAALLLCLTAAPIPEKTTAARRGPTVCRTELPPLAPVHEEKSDASALFQGIVPGTLPAALVSRRNGERPNCRLLRDSNAAPLSPVKLLLPIVFNCAKLDFAAFELHTFFKYAIPPRAGPAAV